MPDALLCQEIFDLRGDLRIEVCFVDDATRGYLEPGC